MSVETRKKTFYMASKPRITLKKTNKSYFFHAIARKKQIQQFLC